MAALKPHQFDGTGSAGNNLSDRRAQAAKEGKCQWCHAKVDLKDQFVVGIDWDADPPKVFKKKDASKKGREKLSHYCGPEHNDCAGKRVKMKESALLRREGKGVRSSGKKKSATPPKKAAPKAAKKAPAKKAGVKRTVKKVTKGKAPKRVVKKAAATSAASGSGDPF